MADDIDATIDRLHAAGATDDEITGIIKEKYGKPFDVQAQNETMRRNMTAQDAAVARPPASQWSRAAMGDRAIQGIKGEVEGAAGGLAGLASLPYVAFTAIRHPVDTAKAVGTGALLAGGAAKQAYDKPGDTFSAVTDAATKFAADPENVGMAAGATGAMMAAPTLTRMAAGTRLGQATTAGLSSAIDRVPGMKEARSAWAASAPAPATAAGPVGPVKASDFLDSLRELPKAERQAAMQTRIGGVADARTAGSPAFDVPPKPMLGQRAAVQPHPAHKPSQPLAATQAPNRDLTSDGWEEMMRRWNAEDHLKYPDVPLIPEPPPWPPPRDPVGVYSDPFDLGPLVEPIPSHKAAVQVHPAHEPVPNVAETPLPTANPDKPRISWPEAVDNARRMHGSEEAARRLYGSGGAENKALVQAIAPGPSRFPLNAEMAGLDQRFKQLISDPKAAWLLPLLAPQVREMLLSSMKDRSSD